ncbi:uncharacterized protein LOC113404148 [Vanessa tameamea]|uniref:Uncharacterized protein LOC113404148 n=1 Tax=Vanessa tameamea TaxID=334116 RepID=A0A8B8IUA3_VANTA
MSTGEDEPSSGLNGRLRPRKSTIPSPLTTTNIRKLDTKSAQDKPKKTTTPSKVSPNKLDDLTDKSDSPAPQILCTYCDKSFFSKQAVSKHIRRIHILSTKQDNVINCLFCNHTESDSNDIIRHMVDNHPNQYFACYDCHTRFPSTTELAEHKLNVCENPKLPYRNKLRQKTNPKKGQKARSINDREFENDDKNYSGHAFNGIVISCELKPSHPHDPIDIEDNITTNLILPPGKSLGSVNGIEKNAIIVLDDLQWNKRIPPNFSFHNTDADQILSRLGVVHRSPRTGENNRKDWLKHIDDSNQKFEKCFDTSFYSKVASNVQENLAKFLDGSFNFNPDPENTIKTRKAKNSVAINTVEGFPILLASDQFSRNVFDGYMPRSIAPKHKWKWENLESDKNLMSPEQIKRDSHTNNCIITLVSSLDIWTQLCMRRKFEEKFTTSPLEKRIEKQSIIGNELKEILESRELPTSSSQVVNYTGPTLQTCDSSDFPASLGLVPNAPNFDLKPAVLSGEWVRPRCYVCCACGAQTRDSRALSSHISTQHPNAQIQHYEIVGEVLLNSDILKHLYVPPSQLNNRTRPLRGFRECTKCRKGVSLEDLHQHMLDCAGDTPTVRRKCRYRPFGVRKRRPRLPDNTIRQEMRKDIRHSRHNRKTHMRPRPKIKTEVGDAETIRKMLADLPAKRHRAIVNPLNPILRPRRKLSKQRSKMVIKKRAIDEMTKKPKSSDLPQTSNSNNEDRQKSTSNLKKPDNKALQLITHSAKRASSGILSHKSSLIKKNTINKNRKKVFATKEAESGGIDGTCGTRENDGSGGTDGDDGTDGNVGTDGNDGTDGNEEKNGNNRGDGLIECSDLPLKPPDNEDNIQINQMSTNNNSSERININDGSSNSREHGNRNSGSNNKDGQNPGCSGQNSNSRDSFAPSQNVPLKHSIARLTASSETHDKSVQFHHLFLVQQECNNATQHLPSGQRMLFENEAVVTKLDKPPLHFNHSEVLDAQSFQRNKLNKPRKGLNDCIAMLRNKLVEPNSNILPGHVSVQCGSDEPLGPEPVVIERRRSTTDSNIETAQRSMQLFYPNRTVEDTPLSYDTSSRVTRRSSTRHGHSSRREKIMDVQPNNDFIYWNQFYYNKEILPTNKSSQRYNKRESTRRRSVVSTEELLLQHAMNLEMLSKSNRNLKNLPDHQYPNVPTNVQITHKTSRKSRQDGPTTRSTSNNSMRKPKNKTTTRTRQKKVTDINSSQGNIQQKISDVDAQSIKKLNERNFDHSTVISNMATTNEKIDHYYVQERIEDKTTEVGVEKTILHSSDMSEEQLCSNMCPNIPMMQYGNDYDILPVHYNMHIDSTSTAPLDLSNKTTNLEDYITEETYCGGNYDSYETLDLSNKNVNIVVPEKHLCINNDEVVDLRVNNSSQLLPSHTTTSLSDRSNNLEDNATDLSYGHPESWIYEPDDCLPTDLSMRSNDMLMDTYEKRRLYTHDSTVEINIIEDLSHPTTHIRDMCMVVPQREDLNTEEPTDLSIRRIGSRTDISSVSISQELHIRSCTHSNSINKQSGHNDLEIPADLSNTNKDTVHNNYYIDEQRMPQYLEAVVTNNHEIGPVIDGIAAQAHLSSIDSGQIIGPHYNRTTRVPIQAAALEPRTIITFSEPLLNETQNMPTASLVSKSSVPCDLPISINCPSIKECGNHNDVTYLMSDVPLSLSTKNIDERTICSLMHRELVPSHYEYENTKQTCTLSQYKEAESSRTNTNANVSVTSKAYPPVRPANETTVVCKSSSPLGHKSNNINNRKLSCENDLSREKSPVSAYRIDMENCNVETLKENYNNINLDQDPETAKKIAMLPKELVEILGTMPADHRIQLLNVLPQYVSSSTSPVLPQHTGSERRNSTCISANSSSPSLISNHSESDLKSSENLPLLPNQTTSSQILQFVETSPTVSSSILLTPPTPQLSDRHSNQAHENNEIKSIEYRRKSRISTDEQTPQNNLISENLKAGSYPTALDEYNRQDRIIDLTGDDFSSDIPDVSYNVEPYANLTRSSKDMPSSAPKSKALKTNSDKTASLRAVRIKTSSERQRTVLTENTLAKKHVDSTSHLVEEELQNKSSEVTMAIQQDEISSTQHRPAIRASPTVQVGSDMCPKERILNDIQMPVDKATDENKGYDVNYSLPDKQNIVTSSLLKDMHSNFKDEIITKDNMHHALSNESSKLPVSLKAIDVRFSKNIEKDYCSQSNGSNRDGFLKDKIVTKTECSISPGSKKVFTVEDDDSEDDVSLAVIVKQKRRILNASREDETYEKINTTKEVEISLDKSSDQKNPVSFNKTASSEMGSLSESQLPKSSNDACNNTKKIKLNEKQNKLSELPSRKKGRKGRRVNIIESTNYVGQQGPPLNRKAESKNEINTENNMNADSEENTGVSDNTAKSEQIEPDNNRSTPMNINVEREKEIISNTTARKEEAKVLHSSCSDCLTSENVIKEKSNFEANIGSQKHVTEDSTEYKLMRTSNSMCEDDIEAIESEKLFSKDVSSKEVKIDETRINDIKNHQANVIKMKESKNICHTIAAVENFVENKSETETDETNLTPLRRSRRGKSLFIDSRSILNDNSLNTENATEPRAPLTKKQLIFSKLLQDEENHKKPVLTTTPDNQISESISKASNENILDNSRDSEFNNYDTDEIKCNKRKKSPQSKKRLKKKKSVTNVQITNEEPEEQEANEKIICLELNNKTPDSEVSSILVTSQLNDTKNITTNSTDSRGDHIDIPSTVITKKAIEKRKSNSPNRDELLPILKLKKPKLNDEITVVSHTEGKNYIKITETQIKLKENMDSFPIVGATRNTTCYNKAIRRTRSKSVCIKSSGTEFYDPYDIDKIEDLEDVIDKTESFVRINVSSIQFNASKSVVAIKTRKLSKTVPSAIIDILPSEAKALIDDVSDDNVDIKNTVEYNNHSNVDTKDGSSDSDASSKSDVPLKIYVQEKEKKLREISPTSERLEKSISSEENGKTEEKSKTRKRYKQTQSINNNDLKNSINKTQNEEELRSEQFMESFGFFSERKPRKSNLLATKKISETYNLIENDEIYYASTERVTKKSVNDNNKEDQALSLRKSKCIVSPPKKATKRGRKKKTTVIIQPSFCNICKKFFRRWDNYVRHLLSLYHISRLGEIELKIKVVIIEEEPNYLLAFRQQLNRLKVLQNKIAKRKKNCLSTADIVLPTIEEILADVKRTIREQQLSRRSLSRDEALFIDCCEMLKESHQNQGEPVKRVRQCNSFNCEQACQEELALLEKSILDDRCAIKSDEEMDSVSAKKILESEEVRNLENDLISNLKEANGLKGPLTSNQLESPEKLTTITDSQTILSNYEITEETNRSNYKPNTEVKDKLYPDVIENIDMFEDKFDKIKRKCRSQAAAAKQNQTHVELNASYKNRKKSEKKKVNNRKGQNTVPTKAALKGFDGVKVPIQTSDINMPAIAPLEKVHRKKRKSGSKKKRERTNSEKSNYRESNNCTKELSQKKVDVYEFMDTEDTEVFEFRPSTLMERLKSINNKQLPSTSKTLNETELAEISSESGSDGDDFVYMSDDYVCSDDETENSILSCELGNGKGNTEHNKTSTLIKRKEATEKNAVMGKIFKNNALRTERKSPKSIEIVKPKANLDQLFDSLLENKPKTSQDTNDEVSSDKDEVPPSRVYLSISPQKEDQSRYNKSLKRSDHALTLSSEPGLTQKYSTPSPTLHPSLASFSTRRKSITPPRKLEPNIKPISISHHVSSKRNDDHKKIESPTEVHSKKYEPLQSSNKNLTAADTDDTLRRRSDEFDYKETKSKALFYQDKLDNKKKETPKYDSYDYDVDSYDPILSEDAGVARQRARRKCTVGKQNVLAETWSSESEPDGAPPRPNSAESVAAGSGRKKKGRKRDSQSSSNRKASRQVSSKKHEYESRVDSSNRSAGSGVPARPRSPPHYWSAGEDEQEHPQQHGWIVGDSHKKLVTMLAHAKGRKRSGDEKRHLLE